MVFGAKTVFTLLVFIFLTISLYFHCKNMKKILLTERKVTEKAEPENEEKFTEFHNKSIDINSTLLKCSCTIPTLPVAQTSRKLKSLQSFCGDRGKARGPKQKVISYSLFWPNNTVKIPSPENEKYFLPLIDLTKRIQDVYPGKMK